jgi:hypothetical protein
VPALPSSVLEPLWVQIAVLLPTRPDTHPLGCHRPRIADRVVFDKLIQILVFGCGHRRTGPATSRAGRRWATPPSCAPAGPPCLDVLPLAGSPASAPMTAYRRRP